MKKLRSITLLLFTAAASSQASAQQCAGNISPFVAYGNDDRRDTIQVRPRTTVVALVPDGEIEQQQDGTWKLKTTRLNEKLSKPLCPGQRFRRQPTLDRACTGFMITRDLLLTANHCTGGTALGQQIGPKIVFRYSADGTGGWRTSLRAQDVYTGTLIWREASSDLDWAAVRLNRRRPFPPLAITQAAKIGDNDRVFMYGYPSGLPLKYSGRGRVLENTHPDYFRTSLDAFGGNSGSPVFKVGTNEVEGILVGGQKPDYHDCNTCMVVNVCREDGSDCIKERVTRIGRVLDKLRQQQLIP